MRKGPKMVSHAIDRMARSSLLVAALAAAAVPASAGEFLAADSADVRAARAMAVELASRLKGQLEAALAAGGAVSALEVCRTVAPAIAEEISAARGAQVARTALKVRNPHNAPDAFERGVLERFVTEAAAGADPAKLEHAEIVTENGERVLRYMKAIPMAEAPCAACHGRAIAPNVAQKIKELYPADKATGFAPGDIRGAFTIVRPMP